MNTKVQNFSSALFGILSTFLILLFASRSSFLYPCNNWDDANSYFSVGKALMNGKMPYRDVFDQKGMYLYFFYGLAYLVSHTTFIGVFFLEWIMALADFFAISKILSLYLNNTISLCLAPIPIALAFSSRSFYWGGSAEEMCLPFILWGLYISLKYFEKSYPHNTISQRELLITGILAGFVANIKFTVLGFFFAFMLGVFLSFLACKDVKGALKSCLFFLYGMGLPFIPWIIYFGIKDGFYYWYWGYVYINVFTYSDLNEEVFDLTAHIYKLTKILYWEIIANIKYFAPIIAGVFYLILAGTKTWLSRINICLLCFFTFLGIYIGGVYLPYYSLPLSVFTVLGIVVVGIILEKMNIQRKVYYIGYIIVPLFCCVFIYNTSMNTSFQKIEKENFFLYNFKEIVETVDNPTLLNIGCLDAGLYTVCDIVPTCQWFQSQTVIVDTVSSEQERYIREGIIDFVIARNSYPEVIWKKYELVAQEDYIWEDCDFTYYLFQRKQ